ncbi:redoxin domain-containing protein [Ferruginibacter sp. SUN106]|uniref:redoxin domain-containing protein n=1 Tax=Ferruginibacter sp. SUN106 TaxID=2978348 RepID=UPI003D3685C4
MKKALTVVLLFISSYSFSQVDLLKAGDRLPDLIIKNIINAPVKQLEVNDTQNEKVIILNFWGTWCSPCIPEMDNLAKLQQANAKNIQVIGISNDLPERLRKYLITKPSMLWLATDTSYFLYQLFGFASVGHSAIIGADKKIIALVNTDSVDQKMINKILKGEKVLSSANIKEPAINTAEDPFGIDSLTDHSFTIRGYMYGVQTMSKTPNEGPYAYRRISFFNLCISEICRDAFDIHSPKQMIYEIDKKQLCNFDDKKSLYCVDIVVKPGDKDSLLPLLQQKLITALPFAIRTEYRNMPVYILKQKEGVALNMPVSTAARSSYGFSGNGYEGTAVLVTDFAKNYLTNELQMPVIDETGLTARYDIKTVNELRTAQNTIAAVEKLGLVLEKSERQVKVIVMGAKKID